MICDTEKEKHVNRCCNFRRQICYQERSQEDYKIKRPYNQNRTNVEGKNKNDNRNNRGNWKHLLTIQKIT